MFPGRITFCTCHFYFSPVCNCWCLQGYRTHLSHPISLPNRTHPLLTMSPRKIFERFTFYCQDGSIRFQRIVVATSNTLNGTTNKDGHSYSFRCRDPKSRNSQIRFRKNTYICSTTRIIDITLLATVKIKLFFFIWFSLVSAISFLLDPSIMLSTLLLISFSISFSLSLRDKYKNHFVEPRNFYLFKDLLERVIL